MTGFALRVAAAVIASLGLGPMASAAADSISLPSPRLASMISVEQALTSRRSVRDFTDAGVSLDEAAQLLWAAQGITHSNGLRTAPSAGALYPLEIYLVAGSVASLSAGIYRYEPKLHSLARTVSGDQRRELASAAPHQAWIANASAVVVIAAVYRRTRAKYPSEYNGLNKANREETMPTYEYRCETCGEVFEQRESIAEHEAMKPKCPKCGNEKVTRAYSRFYAKTAKKS